MNLVAQHHGNGRTWLSHDACYFTTRKEVRKWEIKEDG